MRSYCLATFDFERWRAEGVKEFMSFAFISMGYLQQMEVLGEKLNLEPRQYLQPGLWAVAWDHVAGQGLNDLQEIKMKLWELDQLKVGWTWSTDILPGMPRESRENMFMNTFSSYDEALQALVEPIDAKAAWNPLAHRRGQGGTIRHGAEQSSAVQPSS